MLMPTADVNVDSDVDVNKEDFEADAVTQPSRPTVTRRRDEVEKCCDNEE